MIPDSKIDDKKQKTINLVKKFKESTESFYELVNIYKQDIFKYCYYKIQCNEQEAEDITEEVFNKVFLNLNSLRENEKFKPWLFRIAENACKDKIRLGKKIIDVPIDEIHSRYEDSSPGYKLRVKEKEKLRIKLKKIIGGIIFNYLDRKYRDIFILIHYIELDYEDAAEILNLNEHTAKTRFQRALKKVRGKLKTYRDLYDEMF